MTRERALQLRALLVKASASLSDREISQCPEFAQQMAYDGSLIAYKTRINPDPKTPIEFYMYKMAGMEVVANIEKVFEQEFTFGTEPNMRGDYDATISNAYDEGAVDVRRFINHIDGTDNHFFVVKFHGGSVIISTSAASYAGTTHTLELFYKTVIEDVPVKTRTEQYLKAIAANQDSSDSSESGGVSKG